MFDDSVRGSSCDSLPAKCCPTPLSGFRRFADHVLCSGGHSEPMRSAKPRSGGWAHGKSRARAYRADLPRAEGFRHERRVLDDEWRVFVMSGGDLDPEQLAQGGEPAAAHRQHLVDRRIHLEFPLIIAA